MADSTISVAAGLSGPLIRASAKLRGAVKVKEPFVIPSVPWNITGHYRASRHVWNWSSGIDNWALGFWYPVGAPAGSVAIVTAWSYAASCIGSAGSYMRMDFSRFTDLTGGTNDGADVTLGNSIYSNPNAQLWGNFTATKGAVIASVPFLPAVGTRYAPLQFPPTSYNRQKTQWLDSLILQPGEGVGLKFELATGSATPNGNESTPWHFTWDEAIL